jgi:hypothetical protein
MKAIHYEQHDRDRHAPLQPMSDNGPLADDARNVVLTQTSATTWEVVVTESGHVVGRIVKDGDAFVATDEDEHALGEFETAELAMFGIVNPPKG